MKRISLNNGNRYMTACQAIKYINNPEEHCIDWDVIVNNMDDDTCKKVHNKLDLPVSNLKFLTEYLKIAKHDLIIG